MCDINALIVPYWWQISKGIMLTPKKVHRKYLIAFYLSKAKSNKKNKATLKNALTWHHKTMGCLLFKAQLSTGKAWKYMHSIVFVLGHLFFLSWPCLFKELFSGSIYSLYNNRTSLCFNCPGHFCWHLPTDNMLPWVHRITACPRLESTSRHHLVQLLLKEGS